MSLVESTFGKKRDVFLVDDDSNSRLSLTYELEDAGFIVHSTLTVPRNIEELLRLLPHDPMPVICDNRLSTRGPVDYLGIDVASKLYDRRVPCIVVTQYTEPDILAIRRLRAKIPVLMPRHEISGERFVHALQDIERELIDHVIPSNRKPRKTVIRIEAIEIDSDGGTVQIKIPAWRSDEVISIQLTQIPTLVLKGLSTETVLFAAVNIGAESASEIFVENIELAPEPAGDDGLA